MAAYPVVDLKAIARSLGCDLQKAFGQLQTLYDEVDARNRRNTEGLGLPCHRGCSMCCHESVFVSALEFFYVWNFVQRSFSEADRDAIVGQSLALYQTFRQPIEALEASANGKESSRLAIAKTIRFACPMLSADGACRVYPVRELLARLFGCSFNDDGGVYGCHLVGDHLANKTVTLARARPTAARLNALPLTEKRQVYPYWFHLLYGAR